MFFQGCQGGRWTNTISPVGTADKGTVRANKSLFCADHRADGIAAIGQRRSRNRHDERETGEHDRGGQREEVDDPPPPDVVPDDVEGSLARVGVGRNWLKEMSTLLTFMI